ncbi:hypothetical protein DFJ77DRAFT_512978 [Powellomyces hirtus]|nr:hypothetical protein DFJ77DRAFT_512978 [Powellomyces hirtus]
MSLSKSAIRLAFVEESLFSTRTDLLNDTYLDSGTEIFEGRFYFDNPKEEPFVTNSKYYQHRRLSPHQNAVLANKYLKWIPPRVIEAMLMFLPDLDEPATALPFLLAPVHLESDLARTAIHVAKNSRKHVPEAEASTVLVPMLFGKKHKVTVMKELLRLVCTHISDKKHQDLILALWNGKGLHNDVRVAMLQSVVDFLPRQDTQSLVWESLRECARKSRSRPRAGVLTTSRGSTYNRPTGCILHRMDKEQPCAPCLVG